MKDCPKGRMNARCREFAKRSIVLMLMFVLAGLSHEPAQSKTPGSTYCFYSTCHRVKTLAETQQLVGQTVTLHASHYDDPKRDRYNPSNITSSGEFFRWDRPDNAASPIYPDGTTLLLWNPATRQSAVVRVNNAGPYWGKRNLDVSRMTAEKLGFARQGVATLRAKILSAPTRAEATYRRGRTYPPVQGYLGTHASLESAALAIGRPLFAARPSLNYAAGTHAAAGRDPSDLDRGTTPVIAPRDGADLVVAAAEVEATPVPVPPAIRLAAPAPKAAVRTAKLKVNRPKASKAKAVLARAQPAARNTARLAAVRPKANVSPTRLAASIRETRAPISQRDRIEPYVEPRRLRVAELEPRPMAATAGLRCRPGFTLRTRGEGRQARVLCVSMGDEPAVRSSRSSDRPVSVASARNRS